VYVAVEANGVPWRCVARFDVAARNRRAKFRCGFATARGRTSRRWRRFVRAVVTSFSSATVATRTQLGSAVAWNVRRLVGCTPPASGRARKGNRMSSIETSIEVDVPVRTAYNQWTQFEEFPRFMEGVREVRQLDDRHLRWCAEIGGKEKTWDAEIAEQIPDERIAWHSTSGAANAGVVTFHYLAPEKCRVMLQMKYDPHGFVENVGDALGAAKARVKGDLERFKQFIESQGRETGAWRGEVRQAHHR